MNRVFLHKKRIIIEFKFDWALKDKVKTMLPSEFDKVAAYPKTWSVPLLSLDTQEKINTFFAFCKAESFSIEDSLKELLEESLQTAKVLKVLSKEKASNFEVDGLSVTLRSYQQAGTEYMVKTQRCINGDSVRLGKSVQTLAAIQHQKAFPSLIICKSGLMINWKNEIKKVLNNDKVYICESIKDGVQPLNDFVIINPEKLSKLKDLLTAYNFQSIVFDEAHGIGGRGTKKREALKATAKGVPVRYALTGTPIKNRAEEITGILDFLGRLPEFGGWWKFVHEFYEVDTAGFGISLGQAKDLDLLHDKLRSKCMVRRTKEEVLDEVPQKDFVSIEIPISNRKEYDRLTDEIITLTTKAKKSIAFAKEKKGRIFELRKILGVGKVEAIAEWAEDFLLTEESLVLFAHHLDVQHALIKRFPNAARIIAADSLQVREQNRLKFQNKQANPIICSLLAAGEGQDLSAANTMGICELGWTPPQMEQAIGRMEKVGKQDPLTVYTFIGQNTIDIKMASMLQTKGVEADLVASGRVLDDSYVESLLDF